MRILQGRKAGDSRETLNHFKVSSNIAETAFEGISRCRITSNSSKVGEGTLGGSWAADSMSDLGHYLYVIAYLREVTPGGNTEDVVDGGG
jgi:hypothetical protein